MDQGNERKSVADEAKNVAKGVADDVKQVVQETRASLSSQVSNVRQEVTSQAKTTFDQGRNRVSSQVSGVASAFQRAGEQLRNENQAELAGYSEKVGQQVQGIANYLSERDLPDVMRDVEGFARRNPAVFMGAALALGLVAARFLKSSRPHERA